jgi:hypothetical protein
VSLGCCVHVAQPSAARSDTQPLATRQAMIVHVLGFLFFSKIQIKYEKLYNFQSVQITIHFHQCACRVKIFKTGTTLLGFDKICTASSAYIPFDHRPSSSVLAVHSPHTAFCLVF